MRFIATLLLCVFGLMGQAEARSTHSHHGHHHAVHVVKVLQPDWSYPVDDRYSYMNKGEWVYHETGPKAFFGWQKQSRDYSRRSRHEHAIADRGSYGSNVAAALSRGLAWCGAYMADKLGIQGPQARELWVARNWARVGRPTEPHVGAIVVFPHHVGQIVGGEPGHWIINSGNDGHAVRTRERSIGRAIAIREV